MKNILKAVGHAVVDASDTYNRVTTKWLAKPSAVISGFVVSFVLGSKFSKESRQEMREYFTKDVLERIVLNGELSKALHEAAHTSIDQETTLFLRDWFTEMTLLQEYQAEKTHREVSRIISRGLQVV